MYRYLIPALETSASLFSYEIVVTLDPFNGHAKEMLKKMHFDFRLGLSICIIAVVGASVLLGSIVLRRRRMAEALIENTRP
jgi:hypothetical protein